jgi:ribose transport system substrate-binding protein
MTTLRTAAIGALLLCTAACKDDKPAGGTTSATPAGSGTAAPAGKPRIAVIPKGTTHEFWKSVHAGAVKASREADVEIVWKGPLKEDDLKAQIDVVESFVAQKVSGIVLAPLSDKGLVAPVRAATQAKIPVVVFDSDLKSDDYVSFVATDNVAAGKMAGEHLAKSIGDKGNVVVLRYQEGSASTQNREQGFLDAVKTHASVKVASDNQYGGATTESAFAKAESLLSAQKAAAGGVDGIFAPNESTTFGMLLALKKANIAGKAKFVGFDSSEKLVAGVRDGHIDALVLQDPFKIGYMAVKTMAAHLKGEKVDKRVDTGAQLVTKANMDTPEMKALLAPDLKPWLGE